MHPTRSFLRVFTVWNVAICVLAARLCLGQTADTDGPTTGSDLVARIRPSAPTADSQISGHLLIRLKKQRRDIPVVCQILRHDTTWETIYQTLSTVSAAAERLVVIHYTNAPNQYLYAKALSPTNSLPNPSPITPSQAAETAFAGSDFSVSDLGLDFLFWPQQELLPGQMRLGQPCYVLDSRDPAQPEIVRVKSFIDSESARNGIAGILIAEAYGRDKDLIKEFSLHGSSFKKVNGQYHLEKMEITNEKTGSQTTLKFDIDQ